MPPLLSFQVDRRERCPLPDFFFANVKWSILAISGPTFDSDLRPERDDKRPRLIMDEAEPGKARLRVPPRSLGHSRHSAGLGVYEPRPRGGGASNPQWPTEPLGRVRGHRRGQGPSGLRHPWRQT